MLNHILAKAAALMLLLSFPASTLAAQTAGANNPQAQTAVIYPQAGVTVRGSPVFTSTAVYAGDEIKTADLSTLLTGDGISMQLKPHTSLVFGKVAELGCGGLVLVTRKSIPVRLAGVEVTPSGNPAKLEIDTAGGTTTVAVRSGAATINQAGQISQLGEGQSISRSSTQSCPPGVAGSTRTTAPATSSSFLGGNNLYWIIGGVAAAGITAGVLATRGNGKTISASNP